jgi:putative transposase
MEAREQLEPGFYYHIYNHANGKENLFRNSDNYRFFLKLYHQHLGDTCELICWCLMPNHFHLLVKVRDNDPAINPKIVARQFSHFFNAYVQACNKQWKRKGSLLRRSFRRKKVDSEDYFRKLVCYIHNNPVNHQFCDFTDEWEFSSYKSILNSPRNFNHVLRFFDNMLNFVGCHKIVYEL